MRVLLIEDDPHTATFIGKGLREDGHTVEHAGDGKELVGRAQLGDGVGHGFLLGIGLRGAFEADDVVERRFHVDHHRGAVDGNVELELAVHMRVLLLGLRGKEGGCCEQRCSNCETGDASESDVFHGSAPCRVGSPGVLLHSLQLPA